MTCNSHLYDTTSGVPIDEHASVYTAELRSLTRSALEELLAALECRAGSILLYNPRNNALTIAEIIGANGACRSGYSRDLHAGVSGWVAVNRRPILVENISTDKRFAPLRNSHRTYETDSLISAPLIDSGKLIGVVNVTDKTSGETFTPSDLATLEKLSAGITNSLRSGLSFRELSERGLTLSAKIKQAARRLVETDLELAQIQGFHDNVLRSISLGLMTFDNSLRLTFYNTTAEEIFGFTHEDIGRHSLLKLRVQTAGDESWADVVEKSLAQGAAVTLRQVPCTACESTKLLLDITCAPLDLSTGGQGATLVVEDVGRAMQVERRFAQAEQLATIGKLAASVAHELNNPLDGVLRFTKLAIKTSNGNEKLQEYLGECHNGLQRMSKIVRSLLDYSRTIGKGLEELDPNELIKVAVRNLRPLQLKNNVTVKTIFSDDIPRAQFANFSEVFSNIMRNAYEAMPSGGELSIETRMDGATLLVRFTDTGTGISPEIRDKIFEPFFTTKDHAECTGLGLTICSDIAAKHGGSITVESSPPQGTTFEVRVPL